MMKLISPKRGAKLLYATGSTIHARRRLMQECMGLFNNKCVRRSRPHSGIIPAAKSGFATKTLSTLNGLLHKLKHDEAGQIERSLPLSMPTQRVAFLT